MKSTENVAEKVTIASLICAYQHVFINNPEVIERAIGDITSGVKSFSDGTVDNPFRDNILAASALLQNLHLVKDHHVKEAKSELLRMLTSLPDVYEPIKIILNDNIISVT